MAELTPAQVVIDAMAASVQNRSINFSREQVIVIMQLASDIIKRAALQNGDSSLPLYNSGPSLSPPPPRWFEAFPQFSRPVASYLWYGLASDSWNTNRAGQESFIDFVRLHPAFLNEDKSVLPATEIAVMEWIAHLGARNVPSKTLKSYLIDLRTLHVDAGYPTTVCESLVVQGLIRGIMRVRGDLGNPKLPMAIDALRQLCAASSSDGLHDITFKAAITVAFAAFLRVSEFTVATPNSSYDPATHLSRGSVQFLPDASSPTHLILYLPVSKTDPFRKGASILVAAAPGALTCPVAALKTLFEHDPRPASAPLFSGSTPGQPLTQDRFTIFSYIMLSVSGTDITKHSGVSFRQGAASSAKSMGYSKDEIRLLGRWRSDADKLYSEVPRERLLQLSARLHSLELPTQSPTSLVLPSVSSFA